MSTGESEDKKRLIEQDLLDGLTYEEIIERRHCSKSTISEVKKNINGTVLQYGGTVPIDLNEHSIIVDHTINFGNGISLNQMDLHYIKRALKTQISAYRKYKDDVDQEGLRTENSKIYHRSLKIINKLEE